MARCRLESLGVSWPRRGLWGTGSLAHAARAGRQALMGSHYHPEDVALMVNAGVFRDRHYAEPAFACFIQNQLGINVEFQGRQTLSFDLQNGGCGLLSAAHVVTAMIESHAVEVGMIIAAEANADRRPDPSYTYAASGAAAVIDVSPHAQKGFGSFVFETFDQHHDLYGAVVSLAKAGGQLLVRKQAALLDAYLEAAPQVFSQLLAREELVASDIDLVVPSQISQEFLDRLAPALGVERARIADTGARCGDTLTTSWLLAYHDALEQGRVAEGARVVFTTFGSGVTVGAAAYYQ